ncbi:holo-ACP synthase [Candidatus Microgenomates bacterium]|nr:holo-ACP synthase [Candidatus Microgenomates bacterium]
MKILTGVDLIYLPRFKNALKNGGENFLRRVFLAKELENQQLEHLAGIFAAKEAAIKALSLPPNSWHNIQITHQPDGAPQAKIFNFLASRRSGQFSIFNSSLSISHDGNYVIAQFVAILDEKSTS